MPGMKERDWQVQSWDNGISYEDGEEWRTEPGWRVEASCHTSLECLGYLVDTANNRRPRRDRWRIYCNATGLSEEVDIHSLRYNGGSHLELQRRLLRTFKDLILQGYSPEDATELTDQEERRAYS